MRDGRAGVGRGVPGGPRSGENLVTDRIVTVLAAEALTARWAGSQRWAV